MLGDLHRERGIEFVIHAGASGADLLSVAWADRNGLPALGFAADWARDGKAATKRRNERMIAEGRPNLLVAFPGGPGTAELVGTAKDCGLEILEIT